MSKIINVKELKKERDSLLRDIKYLTDPQYELSQEHVDAFNKWRRHFTGARIFNINIERALLKAKERYDEVHKSK